MINAAHLTSWSGFFQVDLAAGHAKISQSLCDELKNWFAQQDLVNAIGIIYAQYWQQHGADKSFQHHMVVLRQFHCELKTIE